MFRVAVREPVAFGEKVMLMVQLVPPATLLPQVLLEMLKSAMLVPWMEYVTGLIAEVPTFLKVTTLAPLVVPTVCAGKVRASGVTDTAVPVPNNKTAC